MTYSTLKKIGIASTAATIFMGTTAVRSDVEDQQAAPFDLSTPCPPALGTSGPGSDFELLGFTCTASSNKPCIILPEFNFIGVDDQGLNNSQFFKMNLTVSDKDPKFLETIGQLYQEYDIEALDSINPSKNPPNSVGDLWSCLYAASGDNDGGNFECDTGCLYLLDKTNGRLNLQGDICTLDKDLTEIDAIAFRINEGWEELWGWSRPDGLFKIPTILPSLNLCGEGRKGIKAEMICDVSHLVVEDMTWVEKENAFYAYVANEKAIYKFDPLTACNNNKPEKICTSKREIEALEYIEYKAPEGWDLLVMGYNAAPKAIVALDLNDPRDDQGRCKLFESTFPTAGDVEGLAYP